MFQNLPLWSIQASDLLPFDVCISKVGIILGVAIFIFIFSVNTRFRRRRLEKANGCSPPQSRAPVLDPFVGFDFIWRQFLLRSPPVSLQSSLQLFRQLGSTYTVHRWSMQAFHTCDATNIQHMLASRFKEFGLPSVRISVMSDLLGVGIFTLDGRSWVHARALLRPALGKQRMRELPSILERHSEAVLHRIFSGMQSCDILDLQPLLFAFAMDVATEVLMGHSTNMLSSHDACSRHKQFVSDYMRCSEEASKKMRLGPLSLVRFNTEAESAKKRVFQYVDAYIQETLNLQEEQDYAGTSFMREMADNFGDSKALRDQVLHILLASRDTTASLLSNLFFMLAKNPHIYSRLRTELLQALGNNLPTFEQLKDVQYLRWCVNECRYPLGPREFVSIYHGH